MIRLIAATLLAGICASTIAAAQAPALRFTRERPISTAGSGPQRLAIDATLLEAAKPFRVVFHGERTVAEDGLADLRLFDGQGRPVPHLLISPPAREPSWGRGALLPIAATKKNSGFEVDAGGADPVDAIRVDGVPAPFLKRVMLEGSGDRTRWTMLVAEGTLFDLPDERLRETTLTFRRGSYRYLRVTFDDTNSGRVPLPRAVFVRHAAGPAPPPAPSATLSFERRPSEPGRSRYRIRLPAAHLPIVALDLDVGGGYVFRSAVVNESRLAGDEAVPTPLGRGTLIRVLRDGAAAQAMRVPLTPPEEAELELVVEDGNNPPLDVKGVSAVFAELPWIYFEAPDTTVVARYGDRTAPAPRFDLEALRDSIDVSGLPEAAWQKPRILAESEATSASPAFPAAGAAIDTSRFRHTRDIAGTSGGLVALPLDAAVLSGSRGPASRFADVRIVDRTNHQIPYVVERRDEPLSIDVPIAAAGDKQMSSLPRAPGVNRSVYAIRFPYPGLPAGALVLETSARIFQRTVDLAVLRPPDRHRRDAWLDIVASGTWRHDDQQTPASALTLRVATVDTTELLLIVDEGDNAPLPLVAARLLLPSYRLRFFRPEGTEIRLAYGRDDLPPPRYDLALLAPQVMGAAAREMTAAPERGGREPTPSLVSPRAFWAFLATAVIALLVLIVRLVRTA